ncbi:MAG: hypothetical protein ACM3SY_18440 [Candidatus Omnitrophota bacterium]
MSEKDEIFERITQVVSSVGQLKEEQFRSLLGALIKKGGKDAEMLMVKYINMQELPTENRIHIMMTAGTIQNPLFLVPLKKVIDFEPNIHMKKAAVMAVGKFNNQRALNILTSTLQTVGNPYLKSAISEQIDNIKKNNPILALLPRFLKGDKDKKGFMVVIDLLKKNMNSADSLMFIPYLKSEDASLQRGAFELLCHTGDRTLQSEIFQFFYEKSEQLALNQMADSDLFHALMVNMQAYFLRFPALIFIQLAKLKAIYPKLTNPRTSRIFISLFCHCRAPEAVGFVRDVYEKSDSDMREFIIEESAGNEQAIDFLFEKYRSGQMLKEKVVRALLKNSRGFQYFLDHFDTFDPRSQEMIVKSLPDTLQPQIIAFIQSLFKSDLHHLKKFLLSKIRTNFLFSFRDILFDPGRQKELFALEDDYLSTITQLFPIQAAKLLLQKSLEDGQDVYRLKTYLIHTAEIINHEPLLHFPDPDRLTQLGSKIVNSNSPELIALYLNLLEKIKTFENGTYRGLYESLSRFSDDRGALVQEEEIHALKRVKENFKTIMEDIKKIESVEKEIKRVFMKSIPDWNQLRKTYETLHLGVAFKMDWLSKYLVENYRKSDEKVRASWKEFFKDLPILTQLVRGANLSDATGNTSESYHDKLRIIVRFQDAILSALFKDQLIEILPHFNIVLDASQLEQTDILLCDGFYLKEYSSAKTLNTKRIFLYLENRAEFAFYKHLNPRAFFPPLSLYRMLKFMLQELYIMKPV